MVFEPTILIADEVIWTTHVQLELCRYTFSIALTKGPIDWPASGQKNSTSEFDMLDVLGSRVQHNPAFNGTALLTGRYC